MKGVYLLFGFIRKWLEPPPMPVDMYALWRRDIEIEDPPNTGVWVTAKPVGFLLGGAAEMGEDVTSWFPLPTFRQRYDRGPVYVDADTRRYHFAGLTTQYRIIYSVMEREANVGGVFVPLSEDPVPITRNNYQWDQP